MSRRTTREYTALKREVDLDGSFAQKGRILDETCHMTGFSRKYVTNLLNGKTYTGATRRTPFPFGAKPDALAHPI